ETINLGARDGLPPVDWAVVVDKLDAKSAPAPDAPNSRTTWLATVNEDGSPHVTAVGALWLDGAFWFQTGATRKGRNVARDPRCSVSVSVRDADVVLEGEARKVTDPGALARVARAWADQGWPSAQARSRTCRSSSAGWAPAAPYFRSTTKNGTPVAPSACAVAASWRTA